MISPYHKTLEVDQNNIRIDIFLSSKIEGLSRSKIKKLIIEGKVLVDNLTVKPSFVLSGKEKIICDLELEKENRQLEPEKIKFDIIFEDKYFIVINKPSGLVVHPGNGNSSNTLANGILHYLGDISDLNPIRPGIVHRLDKDTSGIIIVAKTANSHQLLSKLFENRMIDKQYKAIVWGKPLDKGCIENFIRRDLRDKTAFTTSNNVGRSAITKYKLIDNLGPLSLIELYPKTGRTHQLRVHMKSINHPIFGDQKYSGGQRKIKSFHTQYSSILKRCFKVAKRHMLHASSIRFIHPFTNEKVEFFADLPYDMLNLIRLLKDEF